MVCMSEVTECEIPLEKIDNKMEKKEYYFMKIRVFTKECLEFILSTKIYFIRGVTNTNNRKIFVWYKH